MKIRTVTASLALTASLGLSLSACGGADEAVDEPVDEGTSAASGTATPGEEGATESTAPESSDPAETAPPAETTPPAEADPEVAAFCEAFVSILEVVPDQDASEAEQAATLVEGLRAWVAGMEPALPADIPEDAERGFEVVSTQVGSLEDDATLEDVNSVDQGLPAEDEGAAEAFTEYATGVCPETPIQGSVTPDP